jgi:copper chaperone
MVCLLFIDGYNYVFQGQGVEKVDISLEDQTVLVTSTLSADQLLETIKKTGKTTSYVGIKQ